LRYVDAGFYKDTLFHRVIANFVVQAGGFTADSVTADPLPKAPSYDAIALESQNGLSNLRGSLAMARTADVNSATSQFYINVKDNTSLDYVSASQPGYAVFGKVVNNLSVIDQIAAVPTGIAAGMADVPKSNILITNAARIQ
jgi:peptidyl-prolyl cis-trans isomerase A (cyclophilin A)